MVMSKAVLRCGCACAVDTTNRDCRSGLRAPAERRSPTVNGRFRLWPRDGRDSSNHPLMLPTLDESTRRKEKR